MGGKLAGGLSVQEVCDILEAEGILSTRQRIKIENREPGQRSLIAEQGSGELQRKPEEIEAIEVVSSVEVPLGEGKTGTLDASKITEAVARAQGWTFGRLDAGAIDRELARQALSRPFAVRHAVLPVARRDDTLILALSNPAAKDLLEELKRTTGCELELLFCTRENIHQVINEVYDPPAPRISAPPSEAGTTGPEVAAAKRRNALLIGGGGLAVGFTLGLVTLVTLWSRCNDGEATDESEAQAESEEDEGAAKAPSSDRRQKVDLPALPSPAKEPAPYVRVFLSGVGESARVHVDDREVFGTIVHVQADGAEHTISVTAPGFLPWSQSVSPTEDMQLAVRLQRAGRPGGGGRGEGPAERQKAPPGGAKVVRDPGF